MLGQCSLGRHVQPPPSTPPPRPCARVALWVTWGRQVTANGGRCLTRVAERWSRASGGGSQSLASSHCIPDCSSPEAPNLTRHGQAVGGGSRSGGGLRGRWGPRARAGSWLETHSGSRGRLLRLPTPQHGDPGQVSRALDATTSRCPAQGPASPPGSWSGAEVGVGRPSTATFRLPCPHLGQLP